MKIDIIELAKKVGARESVSYNRFSGPVAMWINDTQLEALAALHRQALIDSGELVERERANKLDDQDRANLAELQYWRDRHADVMNRRDHVNNRTLKEIISVIRTAAIDRARSQP